MGKRASFDWSSLDRNTLIDILWQLRSGIVGKPIDTEVLHKLLYKQIKRHLPVRVSKKIDAGIDLGWVYIGGCYYSDLDQEHQQCIEVTLVYNPLDEHITMGHLRFKRFCILFADTLLHEIIHMRQYRRRGFKIIPDYESTAEKDSLRKDQSYYGCTDEIDAYSFNIACDLLDKFKQDPEKAAEYISMHHGKGRKKSHSLRSYLRAFEYDNNHPIIKRLKKRVVRYIPYALSGKPYRTRDWINY